MESEFLRWLRPRLPAHPQLRLGPGDDAALLRLADRRDGVVTVDLLSDGVDFELTRLHDPRRIGHKALGVNLSDLAAMAAEPVAAVVALLLPRGDADDPLAGMSLAQSLYEGMLPLAERYGVAIAGGDTNTWQGPLAISVTAIGQTTARGPLLRSTARPGDRILVTGRFGGSILGRHLDVEPRIHEALLLNDRYELHGGLDCSDGLARSLANVRGERLRRGTRFRPHSDRVRSVRVGEDSKRRRLRAGTRTPRR
ncbi:MAG: thiamine-phosphate kinase [Pirellulales bacterium]